MTQKTELTTEKIASFVEDVREGLASLHTLTDAAEIIMRRGSKDEASAVLDHVRLLNEELDANLAWLTATLERD